MINEDWKRILKKLDYFYQPIVNINTAEVIAYEALIRDYDKCGFKSIDELFDTAYNERVIFALDIELRKKAISKFLSYVGHRKDIKLFYNLDNRIIQMPDYEIGLTSSMLESFNMPSGTIIFEVSEKHKLNSPSDVNILLNLYRQQGYQVALDDFGIGYSGLQLLYHLETDYIKIDRFFISDIEKDNKKRVMFSNIINIARTLGVKIIAEGVETYEEFLKCKELGADYVQGYFIQKPKRKIEKFMFKDLNDLPHFQSNRRNSYANVIKERIKHIPSVTHDTKMKTILEIFKTNEDISFVIVLNDHNNPVGILKESTLKEYIYSSYGNSIFKHKLLNEMGRKFVNRCAVIDIDTNVNSIIESYSYYDESDGIVITKDGKYAGFLTARAIIDIVNKKNLLEARDQNPLSGLAGNNIIERYIFDGIRDKNPKAFIYFDFDNFKPYNDTYGFRNGDRIILLFTQILKKKLFGKGFIGHIGGDDFFAGIWLNRHNFDEVHGICEEIAQSFASEAQSFYSPEDRERGFIVSKDRFNNSRKFALLSVSIAMLCIPNRAKRSTKELSNIMGKLKKRAKEASNKIATASLLEASA